MPLSDNLLLGCLSRSDLAALEPFLKPVSLTQKQVLFDQGDLVSTVYFPSTAVVSLVVGLETGKMVEGAMVGRDGVVGASCALDGQVSLVQGIVQLAGEGFSCPSHVLKGTALQSQTLLEKMIRHEQIMFAESQQSTACMAAHGVEERLARWLLRTRDLSGSNSLTLTQEFISEMLGVQRTSVTITAGILQGAGLIRYSRGKIQILNADELREAACECYGIVDGYHKELLRAP